MINKLNCIITFLLLFTLSMLSAQKYSVGGGTPYNISTESLGINIRSYYNVDDKICFGPELSYFFSTTEIHGEEEIETKVIEFNFNAHYIFEVGEKLGVYPLIGLNYTRELEDITVLTTGEQISESHNIVGINAGGGFHVPFKNFVPFVEYEYVIGDLGEHIVVAGLFFPIGKKEEENKEEMIEME